MISGCAHHNDCFTCPFDDCVAREETLKEDGKTAAQIRWRRYYEKNREVRLARQREKRRLAAAKTKGDKLNV